MCVLSNDIWNVDPVAVSFWCVLFSLALEGMQCKSGSEGSGIAQPQNSHQTCTNVKSGEGEFGTFYAENSSSSLLIFLVTTDNKNNIKSPTSKHSCSSVACS